MKYIKGDITKEYGKCLIVHGVNCCGAMGSGIALAIKTKWPIIYKRFKEQPTGTQMLGFAHIIHADVDQTYVANCYTQEFFGNDGKRYANLDAIESSLKTCFEFCESMSLTLKSPKIGAGLGGLDWDTEVLPIFQHLNIQYNVNVEIFYI